MSKPLMLIMDQRRERSPLLTHFYEYLISLESIDVVWSEEVKTPIVETINTIGRMPNFIYYGFAVGNCLLGATDIIKNNNIKVIYDPGDYEELVHIRDYNRYKQFAEVEVDYIVARLPKIDGHCTMKMINEFIKDNQVLKVRNSKIINIPWGIDIKRFPQNENKDIDVSLLCTISGYCGYHEKRRQAFNVLEKLSSKINVFACTNVGPKLSANKPIFGDEYYNILSRSKLFIVDASGRDFPVQKYFEAPACGALVVGEIPTPLQGVLVGGQSAVVVSPDNLEERILNILQNPERIRKMAEEGKRRMIDNFSMDIVVKELMEVINE